MTAIVSHLLSIASILGFSSFLKNGLLLGNDAFAQILLSTFLERVKSRNNKEQKEGEEGKENEIRKAIDFRFFFAIVVSGRGNGKRPAWVTGRGKRGAWLHCLRGSHEPSVTR